MSTIIAEEKARCAIELAEGPSLDGIWNAEVNSWAYWHRTTQVLHGMVICAIYHAPPEVLWELSFLNELAWKRLEMAEHEKRAR